MAVVKCTRREHRAEEPNTRRDRIYIEAIGRYADEPSAEAVKLVAYLELSPPKRESAGCREPERETRTPWYRRFTQRKSHKARAGNA